jgi:hypothetical protein
VGGGRGTEEPDDEYNGPRCFPDRSWHASSHDVPTRSGGGRHRDQIELLRVQDVYVKQQGLFARLLNVGTVVIESSEERLPVHYLAGVSDPKSLMDLVWHHARKERDLRSVKVDNV